jgi:hypothetical protein
MHLLLPKYHTFPAVYSILQEGNLTESSTGETRKTECIKHNASEKFPLVFTLC